MRLLSLIAGAVVRALVEAVVVAGAACAGVGAGSFREGARSAASSRAAIVAIEICASMVNLIMDDFCGHSIPS